MTWLAILKLVLELAALIARRAERADIEKAVLDELEILQGKRVRAAADARNAVLDGRVQPHDGDPYRGD